MNYAVRLYEDLPAQENPSGIPGNWPARIEDIGDSEETPDDGNTWVVMSQEAYEQYLSDNRDEYDNWRNVYNSTERPDQVLALISEAKQFGKALHAALVSNNIILRVAFEYNEVQSAIDCGALYLVLKKLKASEVNGVVTEEILLNFGNDVRVYLGLALVDEVTELDTF